MKHVPMPVHTERRFAPTALMLGNIVVGCSVLAPAAMLVELSSGLDVSIRTAGLLITFGAIMLCIGSPVTAWLTSRIERRTLLTATLAVLALANFASALAPDYTSLLITRLGSSFRSKSAAAPSPTSFSAGRWRRRSACR
jgi:DHA1 family inner membrane transport protein